MAKIRNQIFITGGDTPTAKKHIVTFFDYDGTILETRQVEDGGTIDNPPTLPTHNDLIFEEWNHTFPITNVKRDYDISCNYCSSSGKIEAHIRVTMIVYFQYVIRFTTSNNCNVTIDWGDGTVETFLNTMLQLTPRYHNYTKVGYYKITIDSDNADTKFTLGGGSSSSTFLMGNGSSYNQASLVKVRLSNKVDHLENSCFYNAENLIDINLNKDCTNIETGALRYAGIYFLSIPKGLRTNPTILFQGCKNIEYVSIPDGITAFHIGINQCSKLKRYILPDTITTMNTSSSGYECRALKKVHFPNNSNITDLSTANCLMNCTELEEIEFGDYVATLGSNFLSNCTNLKKVKLPETLSAIPDYMFKGCLALEEVELGNNISSFGSMCFDGCANLKSINIPINVINLGQSVFNACTSLEKVVFENSYLMSMLSSSVFSGCYKLKSIEGLSTITGLGNNTLQHCYLLERFDGLTNVINYTPSVYTFMNCYNLPFETVVFNIDDYFNIPASVFYGLLNLKRMYIPDNTSQIQNNAFYDCINLKSYFFTSLTPISLSNNSSTVFGGNFNSQRAFYVPDSVVDDYKNFTNWSYIANAIQPMTNSIFEFYDNAKGTVSKAYDETNKIVSATATALTGYTFEGWYSDKEYTNLITNNATTSYTVNSDYDEQFIYAKFV